MFVLVDSNVWLDILSQDSEWFEWSYQTLDAALQTRRLTINPIIYAEVSARFSRIEDLDSEMPPQRIERLELPWEAAFLAGKCFAQYRKRGGARQSTLPDFFIGAHAAVAGLPLITRDASRYRTYFPKLKLIAPE